jgi:ABC-type bacteriocin/lantibiotic exporter with double-glycine peptidase domain
MVGTLVGFIAATSWVLFLVAVGTLSLFIVSTFVADQSIREVRKTSDPQRGEDKAGLGRATLERT